MLSILHSAAADDVAVVLDALAADDAVQWNAMFHLAVMIARIDVQPRQEPYKDDALQIFLRTTRSKPKINVVRLISDRIGTRALPITEMTVGFDR